MILVGDCRERLRELPAGSVQTCITSPPYFGLRDYGTASWDGGDPDCEHAGVGGRGFDPKTGSTLDGSSDIAHVAGAPHRGGDPWRCRCGARRVDQQIGLEPSPDEFVSAIVDVFREVRRVLRDDGTVWLNLGDSYNTRSVARPSSHQGGLGFTNDSIERSWADQTKLGLTRLAFTDGGLKEKDLLGIPWMAAFALRSDGWYLRSEIVWAKPNPMPESVMDRPTSAHEKLFLLSKSPRYFYDADAIREATGRQASGNGAAKDNHQPDARSGFSGSVPWQNDGRGRNRRNVWEVTTQPYAEAHFATFPPKLVEPCVLAGAPTGGMVLDPFAGSGTVGVVCAWHGREFVGVELNPEYAAMAERRIATEGRLGRAPRRVLVEQDALFEA